jgi:hypothetical protein
VESHRTLSLRVDPARVISQEIMHVADEQGSDTIHVRIMISLAAGTSMLRPAAVRSIGGSQGERR